LKELSRKFGLSVEPWAYVKDLSTGERQRVEIVKALYRGAHLLVLDEPTAVLTPGEVEELFATLRSLRAEGHSVALITHKLNEVMAICDRVTVLRGGQTVGTVPASETTKEDLARMMVGRSVSFGVDKQPARLGAEVIQMEDVSIETPDHRQDVHGISLSVSEGEIVALAGVAGNGQSSLTDALFGLRPPTSGHIRILGRDVGKSRPCDLVLCNIGRIPEDRQTMGLALQLTISENLLLELYSHAPYRRFGVLQRREIDKLAENLGRDFDIRTPSLNIPAGKLSGGNQQKVILARELHRQPRALIAVDPTRGLDIGATEFVYRQLLDARDRGAAILLVSTDLEEVFCLSDRIAVIYNGKIIGVVPSQCTNETHLGLMMAGIPLEEATRVTPGQAISS
jgi:simple sugar transport system ATP-binding protein